MIPASSIKTAKAYLFDAVTAAVTAAADGSSLGVFYDDPGPDKPDDLIVVGDVRREVSPFGVVGDQGAGAYQEQYDISVLVSVARAGDDPRGTFERMCDLVDVVIAIQRTDPTLGGAVLTSAPMPHDYEPATWNAKHTGRVAEALVDIRCNTVI